MTDKTQAEHDECQWCASIPHPFISVFAFYCPHLQRWGGWVDLGSSTHETSDVSTRELSWGPFDTDADVSFALQHLLRPEVLARVSQT